MMTNEELNISAEEMEALILTRESLASGKFKHAPDPFKDGENGCKFNMGVSALQTSCGTVACIGGWMGIAMQKSVIETDVYVHQKHLTKSDDRKGLGELFYPSLPGRFTYVSEEYRKITEEQAVKAIDNFLETGKPDWKAVLGWNITLG